MLLFLGKYTTKLVTPKLSDFSISPGSSPYHVAAYVPAGNQPATVRIYRYPEFQNCVANKTFFKADSVSLIWNKKGNRFYFAFVN
jgi:translation initiation factor 2A